MVFQSTFVMKMLHKINLKAFAQIPLKEKANCFESNYSNKNVPKRFGASMKINIQNTSRLPSENQQSKPQKVINWNKQKVDKSDGIVTFPNPFLYDSQKKQFKGKTRSELKQELWTTVPHPYDLPNSIFDPIDPAAIFADKIHWKLIQQERDHGVLYNDYMSVVQKHGTKDGHRRVLINWLVNFHFWTKIKDEQTLFLAVQLLDRCLNICSVKCKNLQLLGSAWMLVADKYEEIYPNACKIYWKASANTFDPEILQEMERKVWKILGFKFEPFPTPLIFLKRFTYIIELNKTEYNFALMLLEILLYDYSALKIKPSMQAIASIMCAKLAYNQGIDVVDFIGLNNIKLCLKLEDIDPIHLTKTAKIVLEHFNNSLSQTDQYRNVLKKFKLRKFGCVSNWTPVSRESD